MSTSFDGKHVLVTGASRGISYGVAEGVAREGARVTLLADNAAVAEHRLAEKTGAETAALRCDISDRVSVHEALSDLMEPADMAGAYLFLAGRQAASITGQTLNVDRGEQMC